MILYNRGNGFDITKRKFQGTAYNMKYKCAVNINSYNAFQTNARILNNCSK
jgi:hypothetical protein